MKEENNVSKLFLDQHTFLPVLMVIFCVQVLQKTVLHFFAVARQVFRDVLFLAVVVCTFAHEYFAIQVLVPVPGTYKEGVGPRALHHDGDPNGQKDTNNDLSINQINNQ